MKQCTYCKEEKPLDEFHRRRNTKRDGRQSRCRDCTRLTRRARPPRDQQARYMRVRYGITLEQYFEMWLQQGGACAICGQPETTVIKGTPSLLSVDHDHKTGKVRALLCRGCNGGLGNFRENPKALRNAVKYLALHGDI